MSPRTLTLKEAFTTISNVLRENDVTLSNVVERKTDVSKQNQNDVTLIRAVIRYRIIHGWSPVPLKAHFVGTQNRKYVKIDVTTVFY